MDIKVHVQPDGFVDTLTIPEPDSLFSPETHIEMIVDRKRDCAGIPSIHYQGSWIAIDRARVWFDDSPVVIVYHLDHPPDRRLFMAGIWEASQGQVRDAVPALGRFKRFVSGRKPLTLAEVESRISDTKRKAKEAGKSIEAYCLDTEDPPYQTYRSWLRMRRKLKRGNNP